MDHWNSLEVAKLIASLATPVVVALIGLWISSRLRAEDRRFDAAQQEKKDKEQAEQKERSDERYRRNAPHIELKLDCQFHGMRNSNHLATITVSAENVGKVLHQFKEITLRVRGIKDEPFTFDERAGRVVFPHEVRKRNLVPPEWNFVFIEPGVTQYIPFTFPVAADYCYLLAHVVFEYKEYWPHTAQAVFAVPAMGETSPTRTCP